uniref:AtPDCT1/2 transmembrane domain-containing protein n=1 Tax=Rhizophora mucronata TaxID=61149 RepID=A0A2P2LJ00_RHIMU
MDTASVTITTSKSLSAPCKRKNIKVNAINDGANMAKEVGVNGHGGIHVFDGVNVSCMNWKVNDVVNVFKYHWLPCISAIGLLFFMAVEYTLRMVPPSSPPFDLGFVATRPLHRVLTTHPEFNTLLAGLNTVFVGMQAAYILWTWLVEGRPRATISTLFMFTCRGTLGYVTQLPIPEGFLGSGVDFPVGNVSFFLFFSGHVAGSVIATLDMRRMQRWELAWTFDVLNVLQVVRLLGSRGHYTIDLAAGVGAGILFDSLAGKYEESKKKEAKIANGVTAKEALCS